MVYEHTVPGVFIERPNRFIAVVSVDGQPQRVHVKNTGRCRELLIPGTEVYLAEGTAPGRKTKYDLIGCLRKADPENQRAQRLIHMDSQAPNRIAREWLASRPVTDIKAEYTWGNSRLDFFFREDGKPCLMEVKGVTLETGGTAFFPDAPTERGVKHLKELTAAVAQGYGAYVCFVVQMDGVQEVLPNEATDPAFAAAYREAVAAGVKVVTLGCSVRLEESRFVSEVNFEKIT